MFDFFVDFLFDDLLFVEQKDIEEESRSAKGDRRSSEGRVVLGIIQWWYDDKEDNRQDDDKQDDDKQGV